MATKIRLRRTGTTNLATFRIVAADSRSPRDGRFLEILGHYDPRKEGADKVTVKAERVQYWISQGAQVSDAVRSLLTSVGIEVPGKKKRVKKKTGGTGDTAAGARGAPTAVPQEPAAEVPPGAADAEPEETRTESPAE
jgi:small subunit ribosomal protein S16